LYFQTKINWIGKSKEDIWIISLLTVKKTYGIVSLLAVKKSDWIVSLLAVKEK